MKGSIWARVLSLVLVFSMAAVWLPVGTASASDLSDQLGLEFLLRGFNVLSGNELRNDTLATARIMQDGAAAALRGHYDAHQINSTTAGTHFGHSTVDWAISAGFGMSVSTNAEAVLGKLFKASAHSKFGMSVNASYSNSRDALFFNMAVKHANSWNYINNFNDPTTRNFI